MEKRIVLLLLVATLLVTANWSLTSAQVAIGGDGTVATGAVLDLSQQGAATGGLLLQQVTLTAENANPFGAGESVDLPDGLLVYNLGGAGNLDAGLYVLQGGLWKPAGSGGGGIPGVNVTITPSDPFNLSVGKTKQLNFLTYPPNATYPSMSWNSSDETVATVSNMGVVSAVAVGNTNITLQLGSLTSDPVVVTVTDWECGKPLTAPSGKVYNTAAYSNANLTNLCWTTTSLQEAGQTYTCYQNDCTNYNHGYYYTQAASTMACAALNSGEDSGWRTATNTEWEALRNAFSSLTAGEGTTGTTAALQAAWNGSDVMSSGWDGYYNSWSNGTNQLKVWMNNDVVGWMDVTLNGTMTRNTNSSPNWKLVVRCVRSM